MKSFDRRNNGLISRFEVERSFVNANIHPNLQINTIKDIIKIYAEGIEFIDYYKLITLLIKEAKSILKNSSFSKYSADDFTSSFNNKFKLGPQKKKLENDISDINKSIEDIQTGIKEMEKSYHDNMIVLYNYALKIQKSFSALRQENIENRNY